MINGILKYFSYFLVVIMALVACNKTAHDPYQPVSLAKIDRLDFISKNDSSIFIYDAGMTLTSGRDNYMPAAGSGSKYEWFTMQYSGKGLLTGAEYDVANSPENHRDFFQVAFSRNDRNMLSKVTREESRSTVSLSYNDDYRLTQMTVTDDQAFNRYTITYKGDNVSSVEIYRKVANVEGTTREDYSDYDAYSNPFHFLVNIFYAPAFASKYGPVRYDYIPIGLLLSVNNPKKVTKYTKSGNDWEENVSSTYLYEYGENNYPVSISSEDLSLEIQYHSFTVRDGTP